MFIVDFCDVPFSGSSYPEHTFQIVLYEGSNEIQVNYKDVTSRGAGNTTTAGIENANGTIGLQYSVMDVAARYRELAVRYFPPMSGYSKVLYYPHIQTTGSWEAEVCAINTSSQQVLNGVFMAYDEDGNFLFDTVEVTLQPNGRTQLTVGQDFSSPNDIRYIVFEADSANAVGYLKLYISGTYRVAVPAVSQINNGDIYVTHIASGGSGSWQTFINLVNTTNSSITATLQFNTGETVQRTLAAREHQYFSITDLFGQPRADINSAIITNAAGLIGLELFMRTGLLSGIILETPTTTQMYYPHVATTNGWGTGVVAYNPSTTACTLTITPYNSSGTALATEEETVNGRERYIGMVRDLGLPVETEWIDVSSSSAITGFELFSTVNWMGGYTGVNISGTEGIFPKLDENGGTGIAFVNIGSGTATVTLTAYDDGGNAIATEVITVNAFVKTVELAPSLFTADISNATYVTYSSNREVVGFQLNASNDGTMLDGLPAM